MNRYHFVPAAMGRHEAWPVLTGLRMQGKFLVPFCTDFLDLDKTYGERFGGVELEGLMHLRFRKACLGFEKIHGHRADNDFRNDLPLSGRVVSSTTRVCGPLGRERKPAALLPPCVAPSVDNARIGASPL